MSDYRFPTKTGTDDALILSRMRGRAQICLQLNERMAFDGSLTQMQSLTVQLNPEWKAVFFDIQQGRRFINEFTEVLNEAHELLLEWQDNLSSSVGEAKGPTAQAYEVACQRPATPEQAAKSLRQPSLESQQLNELHGYLAQAADKEVHVSPFVGPAYTEIEMAEPVKEVEFVSLGPDGKGYPARTRVQPGMSPYLAYRYHRPEPDEDTVR